MACRVGCDELGIISTGEGSRLPSVVTTVIGWALPLLSYRLKVQIRAGPLLSKRKRYLRVNTLKYGWMAPFTMNLSPAGMVSGAVAYIWPSTQNNLSVKFSGMS